jgi:hypothetical protein
MTESKPIDGMDIVELVTAARGMGIDVDKVLRDLLITDAVKGAMKKYPDLKDFDNPYERIAEFMDTDLLFPEIEGETSIQWFERVKDAIDEAWYQVETDKEAQS